MRIAGLPTAPATLEFLINTGVGNSSDCEVSPDGKLIYVADDRTGATGGGVQRWEFDGSNWILSYTLNDSLAGGARYVTADFTGASPVVYAVTTEMENNQI